MTGRLLASGRDADIFEHGPGTVLRRAKDGRSIAAEARTMAFVRERGYPAPAVEEVSDDGTEIVMERIDGPSMMEEMMKRPWTLRGNARTLARLHQQLHEIEAPDWLPASPIGPGERVVHMDLHPLNVMLSRRGPVVIDWPNARRGEPAADVTLTWVLMACAGIPAGRVTAFLMSLFRGIVVSSFLGPFDRAELGAQLRAVVDLKVRDPHMSAAEQAAMHRLAARHGTPANA